jgi:glycosyltransferase involved in cell wall biosynthesis
LKIAWFTPFHTESAIGQVSKLVCEEIQKSSEVHVFASEHNETIPTSVPVIRFSPLKFDTGQLDQYDHVVYNMGNYARNHREVWEVMQRHPGILLLHDQIMQNFFQQITMMSEFGGDPAQGEREYLRLLMRTCYGEQGEAAGKARFASYMGENKERIWLSEAAMAYPLFEPLLTKATAVFSHAAFFIEKIKEHFYGPTGYAYLPYTPDLLQADATIPSEFKNKSKTLVVATGIVHPVKRIARVADILVANPDIAKRVQFVVIGNYGGPYGNYLKSLTEGPLKECLYLLGYQSQEVMEAFLREADFCVNLRYPNSEICSKSLIEQMAFENPVIVLDQGVFNEIPDNCVVRINLENELPGLANAFRSLLEDPDQRHEIGRQAVKFVQENCTPAVYTSRFNSFLESIPTTVAMSRLVNGVVQLNRVALRELSFDQQNAPWIVDTTWRELSKVCRASSSKQESNQIIGLWFGFPYEVSLRREGITRFMLYMLLALLERYDVDCEIWAYSFNENEIRAGFELLLKKPEFEGRVRVVTEKNYREVLNISRYKRDLPIDINETQDNLAYLAREYSKSTCFVTAIVYLDNVIGTGKPLFVPVHDLGIHVHYDDFVTMDPLYKARHVDIRSRAENLARSGAFMFSESEHVRREQILKHIASINPAHTDVIYFPVFLPENLDEHLMDEKDIRGKFGLKKSYIFYPTQVRPYKNVILLVEALAILRDRNIDVDLVLTGNPSDVPEVHAAIKTHQLNDIVVCLSNIKEHELFSLYRYAAVVAVPTLFEGGFPLQAGEALYINTPLVVSDIPLVRERIEFCGMSPENSGLELFDPKNSTALANALEKVLRSREKALASQKPFRDKFLSYSWDDAADKYYKLFFEGRLK